LDNHSIGSVENDFNVLLVIRNLRKTTMAGIERNGQYSMNNRPALNLDKRKRPAQLHSRFCCFQFPIVEISTSDGFANGKVCKTVFNEPAEYQPGRLSGAR